MAGSPLRHGGARAHPPSPQRSLRGDEARRRLMTGFRTLGGVFFHQQRRVVLPGKKKSSRQSLIGPKACASGDSPVSFPGKAPSEGGAEASLNAAEAVATQIR